MASYIDEFLGEELLTKQGLVKTADCIQGKYVGLYFSAHWYVPAPLIGFSRHFAHSIGARHAEDSLLN